MKESHLLECIGKKNFVDRLSTAISGPSGISNVEKIEYELYEHEKNEWIQEYIKITFKGGGWGARSVNMNSLSADLDEIATMCHGNCYEQRKDYNGIVANPEWKKIL